MHSGPGYFEIQADETARAVRFYSEVFGWSFSEVKGLPVEYWQIQTATSFGGILKRPAKRPASEQGTNAYVCSMEVANFDAAAEKIVRLGGIVAVPDRTFTLSCRLRERSARIFAACSPFAVFGT